MCIHHLSCNLTIPYCIVLHSAIPCLDLAPEAEGKGWITVPIRADSSSFLSHRHFDCDTHSLPLCLFPLDRPIFPFSTLLFLSPLPWLFLLSNLLC